MADRKDPDSHVQQHVECSICFQVYNSTDRKPKTLPCGHTFCEVCLKTLDIKSNGSTVSCPQDRRQITIPPDGISDLPTNFSILSMADNICEECHTKPKKEKCILDHCQKTLCEGCLDDHCKLIRGSLITSLKQLRDEVNTLQAECDDDEDVQLLEEQCSEAIEAVSLICDELKEHLLREIKERSMSDKETLFKWKMNMGLKITNTKIFTRESISKLSTVTSASATVMGDIQKKLMTGKDNIYAEGKKPLTTSFHPENLEQEIKTMLPNLLLALMSLSAAVLNKVSKVVNVVPDYSFAKFQCTYGSQGKAEGQLHGPWGICVSPATGYLALSDRNNHRIQILNDKLQHLLTFGNEGSGENQYNSPIGTTFNSLGNLFITDSHNHRIQIVSSDGQHLSHFGSKGSGQGQYNLPYGISCDEEDLLHICDSDNYRVKVVKENGEFVRFIGCKGDNPGEFKYSPFNVACSRVHDRVIVTENYNLHFFTHKGQFMKTIKAEQSPYYMKATGVAIDRIGNVIIGDYKRHRLVVLGPDGDLLSTIGGPGKGSGKFDQPRGIAATKDGCLYVSDHNNHCIQLFQVPMKTP